MYILVPLSIHCYSLKRSQLVKNTVYGEPFEHTCWMTVEHEHIPICESLQCRKDGILINYINLSECKGVKSDPGFP